MNSTNLNERYIGDFLHQLEQDRNLVFHDIKNSSEYDKTKELKLKHIETLQRNLIFYKQILNKEKGKKK